jgi:hypothetical protein
MRLRGIIDLGVWSLWMSEEAGGIKCESLEKVIDTSGMSWTCLLVQAADPKSYGHFSRPMLVIMLVCCLAEWGVQASTGRS